MLALLDLLNAIGVGLDPDSYKIHLATSRTNPPLHAFFEGTFKSWQEQQTAKNFERAQVLSLIGLDGPLWLFAGVYSVDRRPTTKSKNGYWMYRTTLLQGQQDLVGRVIVRFDRKFRNSYLRGERYGDQLAVEEVRAEPLAVSDFPGYSRVRVDFEMLSLIVRQAVPSWRSALAAVRGVYLITDLKTGKLYVGSAVGARGIWGRWESYRKNGHGGNRELRDVLAGKEEGYQRNFQFSILEVADPQLPRDAIVERESHWKDVLSSRRHGYNAN